MSDAQRPVLPAPSSLAVLPVFFDLAGKEVLLAGATSRAVWKAELLASTGACVRVRAADPCREMTDLLARLPQLQMATRDWQQADFHGVALAVGDMPDAAEAARFHAAARAAGVPVNCIDAPSFCDFQFGAIVERSPLVIGISTQGAAPVLGQVLRLRIEAILPQTLRAWMAAAKAWRADLAPAGLPFRTRRAFWARFAARALAGDGPPTTADLTDLLAAVAEVDDPTGCVTLVGAGPGDPELVTLKAVRALQEADVVLFDDLVSPLVVDMARREAVKIAVGKRGYKPSCRQSDITARLIALARDGKRVVRLKGGDPMIFGRANEEIAALRAAGIPVAVVPGVTAALGAAAALGTSLTERDSSRRVQFITAHARDGSLPDDIDWAALSDPRATSIVYMGVRTLPALTERLLQHGLDPATPAVLVERATWADQREVRAPLRELTAMVGGLDLAGPCLVMIGRVFATPHPHVAPADGRGRAADPAASLHLVE